MNLSMYQRSCVLLKRNSRSEGFIAGRPDFDETVRRLTAFAAAGADCLYAPGLRQESQIAQLVKAVAPKPVNVLSPGQSTGALQELGVRRISVGGSLARAAWAGFYAAAQEIRRQTRSDHWPSHRDAHEHPGRGDPAAAVLIGRSGHGAGRPGTTAAHGHALGLTQMNDPHHFRHPAQLGDAGLRHVDGAGLDQRLEAEQAGDVLARR